ncbi:MAG: phosphoribosylpyrophosphate synthetase [Nitrososphaera sp.]|nr:phosphoribosylpyrophosphate synthetase [Nitrososphaera sp.]
MNLIRKALSEISVIAGPSSPLLAAGIAKHLDAELIPADLRIFSDGESKIRFGKPAHKKCVVVQSTHPPVDTHLLQAMMMAAKCAGDGAQVCAVIPYLAYARQDKAFLDGEVVSAALVARLLESAGVERVITVDIHSKIAASYFSVGVRDISSIPLLADYALKMNLRRPVIVSPDQGGIARAEQFAKILESDMIALKKSRDRNTGAVTIEQKLDADISGRDAILVDDMISSGGSIAKATEVLLKNNAGEIYAMCAHALMLDDAAQKIQAAGVRDVIATNSIPGKYAKVDLSSALADGIKTVFA